MSLQQDDHDRAVPAIIVTPVAGSNATITSSMSSTTSSAASGASGCLRRQPSVRRAQVKHLLPPSTAVIGKVGWLALASALVGVGGGL